MDLFFHGGLAALLVLVLGLSLRGGAGLRRGTTVLIQVAISATILAWAAGSVGTILRSHGRGLELRKIDLLPPAGGGTVTLGGSAPADVVLPDPHLAPVHLAVRWVRGLGDPRPEVLNLSMDLRVDLDGHEIHDVPLGTSTVLALGSGRWTVAASGAWPGIDLVGDDGGRMALAPPLLDRLLQLTPGVRRRARTLGWLLRGPGGLWTLTRDAPLPSLDPAARIDLVGGQAFLRFPTAADRLGHDVVVTRPGEDAQRPADRAEPLRDGAVLVMGRSSWQVSLTRGGGVQLRPVSSPPRAPWPVTDEVWGRGTEAVALRPEGDALRLTVLDPSGAMGLARLGSTWQVARGGPGSALVGPGEALELTGDGFRIRSERTEVPSWDTLRAGLAGAVDQRIASALAVLAALVLVHAALLSWSGLLHLAATGIFQGALLLTCLGTLCLVRLSDPEDPQRAGIALRQIQAMSLGLGVLLFPAIWGALRARAGAVTRDRVVSWLDGPGGDGRPATLLLVGAMVALVLQLPFGEQGIAIPGLGSVQPMEAARLVVVLFLVRGTARALEEKRARLKGSEGWRFRWAFFVHALPVAGVCVLAVLLEDDSPVLLFLVFTALLYAVSLLRPSWSLWPPSAWPDHLGAEAMLALMVAGVGAVLVLADPDGTIATRLRTWWDPWGHGGENWQVVSALWASAQGGIWGLGWEGANGALPPAVRDDFVLALLAARTGALGVGLCAAAFMVFVLSALRSAERLGGESPARHERASLLALSLTLMVLLQAAIVLGSATGGLPVMGQPLPFVAAAGSHTVLFCLPATALLLESCRRPIHAPAPVPAPEWEGSVIPDISSVGE